MAQFDGLVIGAGHNGLVCAAYLARAGLKIAVLDSEPEIGGGSSTKEFLLPGYQSNMHANFFIGLDDFPIVEDLELNKYGFKWLTPDVQHAALYRDGTAILLHREVEKSAASISKFSRKDADSYVYLHRRFAEELAPLMRSFLFHPPLPPDEIASRMNSDSGREILGFAKMSIFEAIESNFEHPKMRALFFLFSHAITVENAPGTGIFLPSLFSTHTTLGLPVGGAIQLPLALERIVIQNGGVVLRNSRVREVLRGNGRATGVVLDNGEQMMSTHFVASSLNAPASIEMAGEDAFPDEVAEKVRNWDWGFHSLSTLHLALAKPPRYAAENFDPDVGQAYNIIFGADSGEEMAENTEERRKGRIPSRPMGNGSCNSQHDPSYAPPGGHVAFWWPGAPYALQDGGPPEVGRNQRGIHRTSPGRVARLRPEPHAGQCSCGKALHPARRGTRKQEHGSRRRAHGGVYSRTVGDQQTPSAALGHADTSGGLLSVQFELPGGRPERSARLQRRRRHRRGPGCCEMVETASRTRRLGTGAGDHHHRLDFHDVVLIQPAHLHDGARGQVRPEVFLIQPVDDRAVGIHIPHVDDSGNEGGQRPAGRLRNGFQVLESSLCARLYGSFDEFPRIGVDAALAGDEQQIPHPARLNERAGGRGGPAGLNGLRRLQGVPPVGRQEKGDGAIFSCLSATPPEKRF